MFGIDDIALAAVGSSISGAGALAGNLMQANQNRINRQFQSGQANTAYQRMVGDMRAAGLNPILGVHTGGAGSGSGSGGGGMSGIDTSGGWSALAQKNARMQTELASKQTQADVKVKEATEQKLKAETANALLFPGMNAAQIENIGADTAVKRGQLGVQTSTIGLQSSQVSLNEQNRSLAAMQTVLMGLKQPEANLYAEFFKAITPIAGQLGAVVQKLGEWITDKTSSSEVHSKIKSELGGTAASVWEFATKGSPGWRDMLDRYRKSFLYFGDK